MIPNILITVLLVAIVLLVRGLRGRMVGVEPRCAQCGFDLSGAMNGAPCPECGSDVTAPAAVCKGRRIRRRWSIVCGLVGILLSLGGLGAGLLATIDQYIPDLPVTAVVWITQSGDHELAGIALRNLQDRAATGQLSDTTIRQLAMQGIAARDATAPGPGWFWPYAAFFDLARQRGLVTDTEWRDYADNSLYVFVIANEQHQSVDFLFEDFFANPASGQLAPSTVNMVADRLEVQGLDSSWKPVDIDSRSRGPGETAFQTARAKLDDFGSGRTLHMRFMVRVVDAITRETIGDPWTDQIDVPLQTGSWTKRRKDGQEAVTIWRY